MPPTYNPHLSGTGAKEQVLKTKDLRSIDFAHIDLLEDFQVPEPAKKLGPLAGHGSCAGHFARTGFVCPVPG